MASKGVIQYYVDLLMQHDYDRLDNLVNNLTTANNVVRGTYHQGFMLQGKYRTLRGYPETNIATVPSLHFTLLEQGHAYLREANAVELDCAQFRQLFFKLVGNLDAARDLRDALPECLVSLIDFATMPRTRKAAWNIEHDASAMRLYNKLLPKIEAYTMARYIL